VLSLSETLLSLVLSHTVTLRDLKAPFLNSCRQEQIPLFSKDLLCIISPKSIFPHSSVPLLCYFRYLRHSVIPFMFRSVYVPSYQLPYLHYLSPLGSGRILHGSCCVLIVHNVSTFLSFILLLFHYSVLVLKGPVLGTGKDRGPDRDRDRFC
jgi:hypothetical protein